MKKFLTATITALLFLTIFGFAEATTFTYEPTPKDLYDLEHGHYYTWGIDADELLGTDIISASLSFNNIRNWTYEENDLYVHLLDDVTPGVTIGTDSVEGDQFSGEGILLFHWEDLSPTAQDLTFIFDPSELTMIAEYINNDANGNFGFGFDPDCHFYNDGVKLSIETAPVPEPTTMLLLGTGLMGLAGVGRKKFHKKG